MTAGMWRSVGAGCLKAAAVAVMMGAAGSADAASYVNSATGNWSADASWTGGKPAAGGATDAAIVFSPAGVAHSTNNLTGNFLLNRLEFTSGAVTLAGNPLVFTNNGATGPQVANTSGHAAVIRGNLALGNDTVFYAANDITNTGVISGKGGLVKTGAGTLVSATNNVSTHTYVGSTLVSAGALVVGTVVGQGTFGTTNITVQSGATLRVLASSASAWTLPDVAVINLHSNSILTVDTPTINFGYLSHVTGATVDGLASCLSLRGMNTASRITATFGSGYFRKMICGTGGGVQTLRFDGTGTGTTLGTASGTPLSWRNSIAPLILDIGDSPEAAVDVTVGWLDLHPHANGGSITKQGAGVLQINNLGFAGSNPTRPVSLAVSGGTLVLNTSAVSALGVNFASLTVDSGATLQVGAGGTAGAIFTNVANEGTLAFSRSDAYTYTKAISGAGSVVQQGAGTLTFTGAHTYGGGTLVNSGALLVNAPGSLGGSGAVTVTGNGTTLGGNGAISGAVSLGAGAVLAPGGTNVIGTLTLANSGPGALTLDGSSLLFDLSNADGVCDRIPVAGTLVLNGASTIALAFPNGLTPAGTYTLLTYASKAGDGSLALNTRYPNAELTVGETSVTLTVAEPGISYLKWAGSVSGTWDTSAANWTRDGSASAFVDGDSVIFDDTAAGNFAIAGPAAVSPFSVTFNNIASNYAVSASIAGAGTPLRLLGTGSVTLSGANSYNGGTTLCAGTLSIGAYANLPAEGGLNFNGGALLVTGTTIKNLDPYAVNWATFNGGLGVGTSANTLTVTNTLGGSGSLTKLGTGTLVLSGANSYGGGSTVSAGVVRLGHASALGAGAVNMLSGGEVDLTGGLTVTNAITVRGVGASSSGEGSLRSLGGTGNTWSGPITLGENNARIGALGSTLIVSGVIGSGTNKYDLVVRSPNDVGGILVLAANNTWLGNTWIRCGTVRLGVSQALPPTILLLGLEANQTSVTNATFDLAGYSQQVAGLMDRGTDNLHVVTCSSDTFSTLTVSNSSSYAFAGTLSGNLGVVKAGNGTLTLSGTNTTFGGFTVSNGTLAVSATGTLGVNCTNVLVAAGTLTLSNSVSIADSATLRIADGGGAKVNLADGVHESVRYLWFGDKQKPGGTYGAAGSGADVTDNEHFSGSGTLTVLRGNGTMVFKLR